MHEKCEDIVNKFFNVKINGCENKSKNKTLRGEHVTRRGLVTGQGKIHHRVVMSQGKRKIHHRVVMSQGKEQIHYRMENQITQQE